MKTLVIALLSTLIASPLFAAEYHVGKNGNDKSPGSASEPLLTISAAARVAQPGDTITVHAGTYRERIAPPRGGLSDSKRIVYRAAPGERVLLKGSEIVRGWKKVRNDTWSVTIPNSFFGDFNPYRDLIHGDWFNPKGRSHHTGAVYLDGYWLSEAARLDDVLKPAGKKPIWFCESNDAYLLNVAWLRVGKDSLGDKIPADRYAANNGVLKAPCSEGGRCIGWIDNGDSVCYQKFISANELTSWKFELLRPPAAA